MPELPEVETVRRGLQPVIEGATFQKVTLRRENLRFPFPENMKSRLEGQVLRFMGRRAKYLVADIDSGESLIMHLGMSGSFRIESDHSEEMPGSFYMPRSEQRAHDHVLFEMKGPKGEFHIIYNDPRRFGFMDLVPSQELETCKHFAGMGIEPTGNQLDGSYLAKVFDGKTVPLKAALLDQKLIAGLGNIYVCEALWRSGISPKRKAHTIVRKGGKVTNRCEALSVHIRDIISEAIAAGGSSLRDHRQTNGDLGYFQHRFNAYDREGESCGKEDCKGTIARIVQSGRSTFYCPKCQR